MTIWTIISVSRQSDERDAPERKHRYTLDDDGEVDLVEEALDEVRARGQRVVNVVADSEPERRGRGRR